MASERVSDGALAEMVSHISFALMGPGSGVSHRVAESLITDVRSAFLELQELRHATLKDFAPYLGDEAHNELKESEVKPESEWQPPETAPRDGTLVRLALKGVRSPIYATWQRYFISDGGALRECDAKWCTDTGERYYDEDLLAWMPAPAMPKERV